MSKKILLLSTFLFVLFFAVFASADTCTKGDVLDSLRKALYVYYTDPSKSTFTVEELKDLLVFYTSIQGVREEVDCTALQSSLAGKAATLPDNTIPSCTDGTKYGKCNINNKPMYCYAGRLVPRCRLCGCPEGQLCDETYVDTSKGNQGQWGKCNTINITTNVTFDLALRIADCATLNTNCQNGTGYEGTETYGCALEGATVKLEALNGWNSYSAQLVVNSGEHSNVGDAPAGRSEWIIFKSIPVWTGTKDYTADKGFYRITVTKDGYTSKTGLIGIFGTTGADLYWSREFIGNYICLQVAQSTCTDTDGGKDYYVKGNILINNVFDSSDYCINTIDLMEKSCYEGKVKSDNFSCLYGCKDGACLAGENLTCSGKPDLTVTDIEITPLNPQVGQSVNRVSKVKNLGTTASPVVNIKCYVDDNQTCYGSFGPLDPGATIANYSHNVQWGGSWTAVAGTHKFRWVIDADNHANECNESNNDFIKYITVQSPTGAITNCVELQNMKNNLAGDYYLTKDIDCSETRNWNGGAGFDPIGASTSSRTLPNKAFIGSFDGKGYKIKGLHINRPSSSNVGLFGYIRSDIGQGEVKNVGLENVYIIANGNAGGLAGVNEGTISNSYSNGSVRGGNNIGGLVGYYYSNYGIGSISNSYSTCDVISSASDSSYPAGGLVGRCHNCSISNSYSTGSVTTNGIGTAGGLIGASNLGSISNSYWDTQTSGKTTSAGGTGKTTAQMKQKITFTGWDFTNTWGICEGSTYPWLKWENVKCNSEFEVVRITTAEAVEVRPAVYENKIVWLDGRSGVQVYMYDLSTSQETKITSLVMAHSNKVAIYGNKIVWDDDRNGNYDIYMYDLSTGKETQITTGQAEQSFPDIYSDKIVWQVEYKPNSSGEGVYLYDLSTGKETQITTRNATRPAIYGNKVVYRDLYLLQIYLYDLSNGQERQITTSATRTYYPDIHSDKIVWEDYRHGGYPSVYMYDLSNGQERQITTSGESPRVYNNKIVWFRKDGDYGDYNVYMYDLSTGQETQITTDIKSQTYPDVYSNKIVWQDGRTGRGDIYMATI